MNLKLAIKPKKNIFHLAFFAIISSIIISFRLKPEESFIKEWLPFYIIGVFVIAPLALLIYKFLNVLVNQYLKTNNIYIKGVLFGVLMSGSVVTLLGTALVLLSNDYKTLNEFFVEWKQMIIYNVLPRVLVIGPVFGGIIKPLMQKKLDKKAQKLNNKG